MSASVIISGGTMETSEIQKYVEYLEKKNNRKLETLDITIDGEFVDLHYKFVPTGFERIRRITGYLVGDMSSWNEGKKAEEKDRVKHDTEKERL